MNSENKDGRTIQSAQPQSVEVALTLPELWVDHYISEPRGFIRRLLGLKAPIQTTGASPGEMKIVFGVIFPDGEVGTAVDTIKGKSKSPYTRNYIIRKGKVDNGRSK